MRRALVCIAASLLSCTGLVAALPKAAAAFPSDHIDIADKDPSEYPKLRETYTKLLEQALAIDPNKDKKNRLVTIITQRRARAMLDHIDTKIPK